MADTPRPRITGLPVGVKACFKFMIPASLATQEKTAVGVVTKVNQQMGFLPCIESDCALWNSEKDSLPQGSNGECWDVTRSRAAARIAKLKWDEVVGSEH